MTYAAGYWNMDPHGGLTNQQIGRDSQTMM